MAFTALAIMLVVFLMVRRITRPLKALSNAAERLGRGEQVEILEETGPAELRGTTAAFNAMQERLTRFVRDRTAMLAAISHDLRTPLTSLRLHAELVDDEETRTKLLAILEEIQRMTEATLAFAREEGTREETRLVDLSALVESLCDDLAEIGMEVSFAGAERAQLSCRPVGLRRALRNILENAVAYGHRARVSLEETPHEYAIIVDDDGPGIPEEDRERVFGPFVRLEESRSRDTGGIGIGMAIARSIMRAHGGYITLENRPGGALRATLHLPKEG
jgi:signal transduction histidine kinase